MELWITIWIAIFSVPALHVTCEHYAQSHTVYTARREYILDPKYLLFISKSALTSSMFFVSFHISFHTPHLCLNPGRLSVGVCSSRNDGLCVWRVKAAGEGGKLLLWHLAFLGWVPGPHRPSLRLPRLYARPQQWLLPARLRVVGEFQLDGVLFWKGNKLVWKVEICSDCWRQPIVSCFITTRQGW